VVGGTNVKTDITKLRNQTPQILVATPGRLIDHLENTPGFIKSLSSLRVLVFDEADQLLNMGFAPAIKTIMKHLQKNESTRQTMLFSATFPGSVDEIAKLASMKKDYRMIDTVGVKRSNTSPAPSD